MEFRLSTFLIGVVMFSLFVGAFAIPYAELGKNYNVNIDDSFNETYNKIQAIENTSNIVGGDIESENPGALDAFFLAGRTILSAPKTVFQSLGIVTVLLKEIQRDLGIPSIFIGAALTIITIAISFAIISLWARFKT